MVWNPLTAGLPNKNAKLRFEDEADGKESWFVVFGGRKTPTARRRTRNLAYIAYFAAAFFVLMSVLMIWDAVFERGGTQLRDPVSWTLVVLGIPLLITGVYFVPAGVLLRRMSKHLVCRDFRLFMVVSRVFMVLPLLCGVVMYVVADRDWSLVILSAAFWVLPQMYVNFMEQFVVVVAPDDDGSPSIIWF